MYQYSLPWFVNLFVASIGLATFSTDVPERLDNINGHFTYALYCNVCRSLFEKDKLLFAFLLCSRILESRGSIDAQEWLFLLTGGLGHAGKQANPAPEWLSDRAWSELCKLSLLPSFAGAISGALTPGCQLRWGSACCVGPRLAPCLDLGTRTPPASEYVRIVGTFGHRGGPSDPTTQLCWT